MDKESNMKTQNFSDNLPHLELKLPKELKGYRGKHWIFVIQNVAIQYILKKRNMFVY